MKESSQNSPQYWGLVPGAGVGRRMGGNIPKQYLTIAGKTVIEHSVERLLACQKIQTVIVAIGQDDEYFQNTSLFSNDNVITTVGGAERCHSVKNALLALLAVAKPEDWVLVHDAARPCVTSADIDALIESTVSPSSVGAVLGVRVRDTMKKSDSNARITHTVDRENLWHAHTPQVFRIGSLLRAIEQALEQGAQVTDESSAMEIAGFSPIMIAGQASNIKITLPSDLTLAEYFLSRQTE